MTKRKPSELVSDAALFDNEIKLAKAASDTARLKKSNKSAMDSAIESERRLDALLSIRRTPEPRKFLRATQHFPDGVAVIVPASDWHVEERVFSEATNGKNSFDLKEAEARIRRFYSKILELIDWQNHLAPVAEIWHPLLGDLLTGYIHEELMETNALSPTETCVFLQDMICSGIDLLLQKTKLPIFIPTCVGNHGRTTIKKRIKTSYKNSYEWLLYMTLAKRYENSPRVFWRVGRGYHNIQSVMGRKVRFHHGDGLRYNGGVGGITIPVNKSIAQWNKVSTVDLDIFGHYHQHLVNYPTWVSCGSLMGYSEYSVEIKADFQHPTQTFIVVDRNFGLTCAVPIFITGSWRKLHEKM
jgi:hypothetical protein